MIIALFSAGSLRVTLKPAQVTEQIKNEASVGAASQNPRCPLCSGPCHRPYPVFSWPSCRDCIILCIPTCTGLVSAGLGVKTGDMDRNTLEQTLQVHRKGGGGIAWPEAAQSGQHPSHTFFIPGTALDSTEVTDITSDLRKQTVYLGKWHIYITKDMELSSSALPAEVAAIPYPASWLPLRARRWCPTTVLWAARKQSTCCPQATGTSWSTTSRSWKLPDVQQILPCWDCSQGFLQEPQSHLGKSSPAGPRSHQPQGWLHREESE